MKNSLLLIILSDLRHRGKLPLLLLIFVIVSALSVLWTTYQTRLRTQKKEQLILEKQALQMEWNNLILEENVLADPERIRKLAKTELNMKDVEPAKEIIVLKKN